MRLLNFCLVILVVCLCSLAAHSENNDKVTTADTNQTQIEPVAELHPGPNKVIDTPMEQPLTLSKVSLVTEERESDKPAISGRAWLAEFPGIVSLVFLVLGVIVAYFHIDQTTRPTLTILIHGETANASPTQPVIENTSKTDAEGTVILRLLISGEVHQPDDDETGAYSGKRVWYFPATERKIKGSIDLGQRVLDILGVPEVPEGEEIYLESCIHYRRFDPSRTGLWKRFRHGYYRRVFRSPIQRWKLYVTQKWVLGPPLERPQMRFSGWRFEQEARWILVPDFKKPQIPYTFDWGIFGQDAESKNVAS